MLVGRFSLARASVFANCFRIKCRRVRRLRRYKMAGQAKRDKKDLSLGMNGFP